MQDKHDVVGPGQVGIESAPQDDEDTGVRTPRLARGSSISGICVAIDDAETSPVRTSAPPELPLPEELDDDADRDDDILALSRDQLLSPFVIASADERDNTMCERPSRRTFELDADFDGEIPTLHRPSGTALVYVPMPQRWLALAVALAAVVVALLVVLAARA